MKCRILNQVLPDVIVDLGIKRLPHHFEERAKKFIEKFSQTNIPAKKLDYIRSLLTLVNEFLRKGLCKNEVELDSLLLYLFYCIVIAEPRNMISDAKLLYMSLDKDDEIRLLGNLAVQLLSALQFLTVFVSDLCGRMRRAKFFVSKREQVPFLREQFKLGPLKIKDECVRRISEKIKGSPKCNDEDLKTVKKAIMKNSLFKKMKPIKACEEELIEHRLHKKLESKYQNDVPLGKSIEKIREERLFGAERRVSKLETKSLSEIRKRRSSSKFEEDNDSMVWEVVGDSGIYNQQEELKLPQNAMLKSQALDLQEKLKEDDDSSDYLTDSDFISEVDNSKYMSSPLLRKRILDIIYLLIINIRFLNYFNYI